ncbi:MAG: ABC transporter substrate-binding protein, partial [Chloroflexota bacterium]
MSKEISRRDFIKLMSASTGAFVLASNGLIPVSGGIVAAQDAALPGTFPRPETVIIRQLTGRVGSPDNFNQWVGWKWQDRGIQNLADEPLWSVDFATGKIINGVADGDPKYNPDFTSLTVPLRKGIAWSDGEPFTSADVVYTVETLMKNKGFNDNSFFVDNVDSVTAPDDYTVEFKLK